MPSSWWRWVALFFLCTACASQSRRSPGAHWERIESPESVGYSRERFETVRTLVRGLNTTGLMVIVGGRVLMEEGNTSELSYLASARKSVLAMLFGNEVRKGTVRLNQTLGEWGIDDIQGLTSEEKQATVADLLTSRSGVYLPASNPGDSSADAPERGSKTHGTYFLYNNWDFNALGTLFERASKHDIYDALEHDLAQPLQLEDFKRDAQKKSGDDKKSTHLAYHMWLSTRDMARLGLLMLREGEWNGRQVIPREWVRQSTRAIVRRDALNPPAMRGKLGYGYLWWVWDDDASRAGGPLQGAYTAIGAFGQFITVIPKLDMVIAHKTKPGDGRAVTIPQYLTLVDALLSAAL